MVNKMTEKMVEVTKNERLIIAALRELKGRATLGDIVLATDLNKGETELELMELLGVYKSHLAVTEDGELLYLFDLSFKRRGKTPDIKDRLRKMLYLVYGGFKFVFKLWIMLMLIVYSLVFVVLLIGSFIFMLARGDSSSSKPVGSKSVDLPLFPIYILVYIFDPSFFPTKWKPATIKPKDGVPFYQRVFSFVFGYDVVAQAKTKSLFTEAVVANKGILTTAELALIEGYSLTRSEEKITELLVRYHGDVTVDKEGFIFYSFKDLLVSGGNRQDIDKVPYFFHRLENRKKMTGNARRTDYIIAGFNTFNLVCASILVPFFVMPQLGLEGGLFTFFLCTFPLIFSLLFFLIPLIRLFVVRAENERRRTNVLRKLTYQAILRGIETPTHNFDPASMSSLIERRYPEHIFGSVTLEKVRSVVDRAHMDLEGEVGVDDIGNVHYFFPLLATEVMAAKNYRDTIKDSEFELGEVVFSSAD